MPTSNALLYSQNAGRNGLTAGMPIFGGKDEMGGTGIYSQVEDPAAKRARESAAAEAEKQRQFQAGQNDLNRQTQLAPFNAKQEWLNKLFPSLQGALAGGITGSTVGGTVGTQPNFTPAPVYDSGMIEQQVNNAVGQNDARTATMRRLLGQSSASRGLGLGSPAVESMNRSLGTANMRENATAEREIPFQAAQANADSMFRGNQLQQQMYNSREDSDIRRRQQQLSGITSLLNIFGG